MKKEMVDEMKIGDTVKIKYLRRFDIDVEKKQFECIGKFGEIIYCDTDHPYIFQVKICGLPPYFWFASELEVIKK